MSEQLSLQTAIDLIKPGKVLVLDHFDLVNESQITRDFAYPFHLNLKLANDYGVKVDSSGGKKIIKIGELATAEYRERDWRDWERFVNPAQAD